MEPTTEPTYRQDYKEDTADESRKLSERLKNVTPSTRKMEKAREIISKINPEQFKAVTGRDLFKK